eukprot:4095260-Amphidinium_carterae.1
MNPGGSHFVMSAMLSAYWARQPIAINRHCMKKSSRNLLCNRMSSRYKVPNLNAIYRFETTIPALPLHVQAWQKGRKYMFHEENPKSLHNSPYSQVSVSLQTAGPLSRTPTRAGPASHATVARDSKTATVCPWNESK